MSPIEAQFCPVAPAHPGTRWLPKTAHPTPTNTSTRSARADFQGFFRAGRACGPHEGSGASGPATHMWLVTCAGHVATSMEVHLSECLLLLAFLGQDVGGQATRNQAGSAMAGLARTNWPDKA
jgi:hypothetical protein